MSYLKDFRTQIAHNDYPALLRLWEEYCAGEEVDSGELIRILKEIKASPMAEGFGRHVEKGLTLWSKIEDPESAHLVLQLIIDLETINSEALRQLIYDHLQNRYGSDPIFNEKIRLIGLRNKESVQGAISNYELLSHMKKGKFVFHSGGWGVGEIVDVSLLREQLSIEFDYVGGKKDLSFANAFKTLIPIPDEHFLALRFGSPDLLEKKAKENPIEVIHILLRDLGPKTAAEIKDELCDLVIPAAEWQRWWQNARSKIKKDTLIQLPEDLKEPFRLREQELTHESRLQKELDTKPDTAGLIQMVYTFLRDFPETLRNPSFKEKVLDKLKETLSFQEITPAQELQIHFFFEDLSDEKESRVEELVKKLSSVEQIVSSIDIIAFKKRLLVEVRKYRSDWKDIFLNLLFVIDQNPIRDYILSELQSEETKAMLQKKIETLLAHPAEHPEAFLWYFQKVISATSLLFANAAGRVRFFESFLILLQSLENKPDYRDLVKKMQAILTAGRFAMVRQIMQEANKAEVQEFLLLATKCHTLSDHDIKILHSLAEVAHPSLGKMRKEEPEDEGVIWTTEEGYNKLKLRIEHIGTIETVENAKEIEVARSHGDLRENAEFKSALEKRDRLQNELKTLSGQLNASRILTKADISKDRVGVGSIVECKNKKGEMISYTILGPFDADPEKHILASQSKLALAMKGLKIGDKFQFQGEEYTITGIHSFL